jgi:hypothetical protein
MTPNRRTLLGASGALAAAVALPARAAPTVGDAAWHQAVLERYAGFGIKASGGAGDNACGAWLEGELKRIGYRTERQRFDAPFFNASNVTLVSGAARAAVIPQAVVTPTGPAGVSGPLKMADQPGDLTGAIALISLPRKGWAGIADPQVNRPVTDALKRGAIAAVAITNGPSGEAVALNVRPEKPPFDKPVAILAPKDAAPFLAAAKAGAPATLTTAGKGGLRPAWNLIGRFDRKAEKTIILSTPRSGWFTCVAERGSGLSAWLALAHWLAAEAHGYNLELLATSGHEYLYMGGEHYLKEKAPPPAKTRLWCHIGASLAARGWRDEGGVLKPTDGADPGRVLTATADILEPVRAAFRGLPGLENTRLADKANAGGELVNVIDAGYATAIGEYGGHTYFHTRGDDLRCTSGEMVRPVAQAFRTAIKAAIG